MKHTPTTQSMPSASIPRRDFLKSIALAGSALAFPMIVPSRVLGENAPSKRINVALIGLGCIMKGHFGAVMGNPGFNVLAVCDVYRDRREAYKQQVETIYGAAKASGSFKGCDAYNEFERILERPDIDAVMVTTPDHWHVPIALADIRAGKDVYVEKPMHLTIREGRMLVDAVAEYGAILQVGSQQRSEAAFRRAAEIVRNGWIGKIREVQVAMGEFHLPTPMPEQPIPEGFDYDRWLGSTPWFPYHPERVMGTYGGGWRCHWEYGSRMQGDWGAHHFDIVQWALGMDESGPVAFMPAGIDGDNPQTHTYASGTVVKRLKKMIPGRLMDEYMIRFIGESGEVLVARGECIETDPVNLIRHPLASSDVHLYKSDNHRENWLDCMRTRKQPICPASVGYRSATLCALNAIAQRLGRPLKWDPVKEEILGDEEASRYLSRPRRAPYFV